MTLELKGKGTDPGLSVKTDINGEKVFFNTPKGQYDISTSDFLAAAYYVIINNDLEPPSDGFVARRSFVWLMKKLKQIPGYNKGNKRYGAGS